MTVELVIAAASPSPASPVAAWRLAEDDATRAYAEWRRLRDARSYAVYRASADRADAAQDELAASVARSA